MLGSSLIQQLQDTKMELHQKMQIQDQMEEFTLRLTLKSQRLQRV